MFDRSMPDVHLAMCASLSGDIPAYRPPAPYRLRTFRPGEERAWSQIETSAEEFANVEDGLTGFDRYFGADALLLPNRMFFIADESDTPVATTTAWFSGDTGMLHWVAVDAAHQGKGLSRPVISAALYKLQSLGYTNARLNTQPPSWVAIRLYLEFGFRPVWTDDERAQNGWRLTFEKLGREFTRELCAEPECY